MPKLKIIDSSGREREVEISSKPLVFGRGEDSDCVLGSRSVARHHMKIWVEGGKVMVEDLSGGQGMRLGGEPASGTFEMPDGVDMEVGAFVFSLPAKVAPKVEAPAEAAAPVPLLAGTKGATKGLEIELQDGVNSVGRDPASYLAMDDPSISRQHARLMVESGRFTLIDMHSSNGTFLNGKRIETANLHSGDVVKFGNLEFRFLYGAITSEGAAKAKRKKLMLVGGGSLAGLLLIFIVAAKFCHPQPTGSGNDQPEQEVPPEIQYEQHLKNAQAFMAELKWDDAEKEVDKALDFYPIGKEGREAKKRIKAERTNKGLYEEANTNYDVGKRAEALVGFKKIPKESAYFAKCKYKISELEKVLSEYYLTEIKSYYRANNFKETHNHLKAYMELNPCDRKIYDQWVKKTESSIRYYNPEVHFVPLVYNCTDKEKEGNQTQIQVNPEEELKAVYPEPKIFEAMRLYYAGKADSALHALRKIEALSTDTALVKKAKDLDLMIKIVNGKYEEGTGSVLQGDLKAAKEQFRVALENDAKIVPSGARSYYREDIGKQLANRMYKEGLEAFNRGLSSSDAKLLEKAFGTWMDCLKVKPDETTCAQGLQSLENQADDILEGAKILERRKDKRAFDDWELVMRITRPESMAYKNAEIKLRDYQQK